MESVVVVVLELLLLFLILLIRLGPSARTLNTIWTAVVVKTAGEKERRPRRRRRHTLLLVVGATQEQEEEEEDPSPLWEDEYFRTSLFPFQKPDSLPRDYNAQRNEICAKWKILQLLLETKDRMKLERTI
jgi:hypothetical protein